MEKLPLGERIRAARITLKMTQDELARDTFSKSYVSAVELGKIQPSIKALRILARRLNLPASHFLENIEPDPETQKTLYNLARARMLRVLRGRDSEILAQLEKLDRDHLSEHQLAEILYLEGYALAELQREGEALEKLAESRQMWDELDEEEWQERVRTKTGEIYLRQRKFGQAQEHFEQGRKAIQADKVRDVGLKLLIYSNLANCYSQQDYHDAARALFDEANPEARIATSIALLVQTQDKIGEQYLKEERFTLARYAVEQACTILSAFETYQSVTNLQLIFGQVYSAGHNWAEAEACYQAALNGAVFHTPTIATISALTNLANLYLRQDRTTEALQVADQARHILEHNNNTDGSFSLKEAFSSSSRAVGDINLTLARISHKKGDSGEADNYFNQAVEALKKSGENTLLGEAYFWYGEILLTRGEAPRGAQYLKLAYEERSRGNG